MGIDMSDEILEIIRGDDEAILVTIKDVNNVSQLVAGDVISFTVKRKMNDPDSKAIFQEDYELTDDVEEYTIDLSNTETELPLGIYYCDLQWVNNTKVKTIYRGPFEVSYDITRRVVT